MCIKKALSEFIGTLVLVLIGCGTAVIAGKHVGYLGIAIAFGLALISMAYSIGPISGCHINPAVSLGAFVSKRITLKELVIYIISQCLGAIVGAAILLMIVKGHAGYTLADSGLGQNGWGPDYLGGYPLRSALVFEFVASLLFVFVVISSAEESGNSVVRGIIIGLTLAVIHILGIDVTGVSVNPARSLGPALLVGGQALSQLWLFLLVPSLGGILAGFLTDPLTATKTPKEVI